MEQYKDRKKIQALLLSLGMREQECQHWAGVLGKYSSLNFFPDCELRWYLRIFRRYLDDRHERWSSGHSYAACFYMWENLAAIWSWRKTLTREERWALKGY